VGVFLNSVSGFQQ